MPPLTRRYFLPLLTAAALPVRLRAANRKVLIALFDGFGPDYLERSDMPNLKRAGRAGQQKTGKSVIPSVTNVNNASLVTASFPAEHGITTNFMFDPVTGTSHEMESAEYLLRPTIFERAGARGWKTALVTAKDKVRTLCARGAHIAVSAEKPSAEWTGKIGPKENMYSAGVNYWTLRAARTILREGTADLLYLSTTDYMMHTYAPEDARSLEHLHNVDRLLGEILDENPGLELYLTADHGMNAKREAIDLARVLSARGVRAEAVPIIRDKHKVHHGNLGGACYVYLQKPEDLARARAELQSTPGVEEVYERADAARLFHLNPERIGHLFVLGAKDVAFGELDAPREKTKVRSHGSRHEAAVPLIVYGRKVDLSQYEYNLDLTRNLSLDRV